MKKIAIALTFLAGTLAHASSPAAAVTAALEATADGRVRLDLRADGSDAYRVLVRQVVVSPAGVLEAVPVAEIGIGASEARSILPPCTAVAGAVVRIRYEIVAIGMTSGRVVPSIADRAFAVAADGRLRPLGFEDERLLVPPVIVLTGEPVPAAVIEELVGEAVDGSAR